MGKYIKKSKLAGDVSSKDISHPITFGFRTRAAKNLALQRLRSHSTAPSDDADSFRYLQLRSRRLVKLPFLADTGKQQRKQLTQRVEECQSRNPRTKPVKSDPETAVVVTEKEENRGDDEEKSGSDCNFGEKGFDFESGDR